MSISISISILIRTRVLLLWEEREIEGAQRGRRPREPKIDVARSGQTWHPLPFQDVFSPEQASLDTGAYLRKQIVRPMMGRWSPSLAVFMNIYQSLEK